MAQYDKFINSNFQLGNLISGYESLAKQFMQMEGGAISSVVDGIKSGKLTLGSLSNNIAGKSQQAIMWSVFQKRNESGDTFSYDPFAIVQSFVPGNYGKVSSVTNPTDRRTKTYKFSEDYKEISDSIKVAYDIDRINTEINIDIANKGMVMHIFYKNSDLDGTFDLLKLRLSIGHQPLVDSFNNNWNSHSAYGRSQKNYIYTETERSLPISLYEYATSKSELLTLYKKLENLSRLNYPYIEKANNVESLKSGTIIYFTIGNLYKNMPAKIDNMSFEYDENMWDMDEFVPMMVKVNMKLTLLHNENPSNKTTFFEWINNSG